jgi:uncharacterized damage-inducible protein DinB
MSANAPCAWRAAFRRTKSIGPTRRKNSRSAIFCGISENVQCRPARYTTHGKELADGYENVMAFVERLHVESMEIFARLTDEDLQRKCTTPDNAPITTWKWLRLMPEHEIHHRGQIYLYLGMLGVKTPPLYGLTSEEVRARSVMD